jgi:hypothetical protein
VSAADFATVSRPSPPSFKDEFAYDTSLGQIMSDAAKSWVMISLTVIFIILYGAALTGWLRPLADDKMVAHLEPIIFVIIGYYFGRMPAQQNEKSLKDEISRQTQKADATQHAKEQAQQAREALEEKLKNVRAALAAASPGGSATMLTGSLDKANGPFKEEALRNMVVAAISILNS